MAEAQVVAPLDAHARLEQRWVPAGRVVPHPAGPIHLAFADDGDQVREGDGPGALERALVGELLEDESLGARVVEQEKQGHGVIVVRRTHTPVRGGGPRFLARSFDRRHGPPGVRSNLETRTF